ncbi:hypothetical protein PG985_003877 [Apiospora marii]|uniref:Uncharacterized protein n=1 Tax=Apiospora marii TaxID=335849 RepID=A0ABR1SGU2_9PEZI
MPPKRKRVAPPPPSPPPEPRVSSSPAPAAASDDQDEEDAGDHHHDDHPLPTLFNTTFALYRASPLYLGPERLNKARLQTLSKRLRDTLVGDVVRGVQVGLTSSSSEDATLGRAGALESVDWRWVPLRKLLPRRAKGSRKAAQRRRRQQRDGSAELGSREEDADEDDDDENPDSEDDRDRNADARALSVELRYENNTFAACLLPRLYKNSDGTEDDGENTAAASQWTTSHDNNAADLVADRRQFMHLPLLLLRMPAPLRTVLNDFLARTFDVRIRPLRLGTRSVVSSWAAWHANSGVSGSDKDRRRGLVKDVVLSLGFHVLDESLASEAEKKEQQQGDPAEAVADTKKNGAVNNNDSHPKTLGLKAIDIIVPAEEVRRFIRAGQQAIQDREEEASGNNKRKGKRKAGEQSSDTGGADKLMMSPSRRRKLAGGRDDEGWTWRSPEGDEDDQAATATLKEPFTEALGVYLDRHLALNMFHPGVRILRIACEGFVLSEGRIKVFRPPPEDGSRSAWRLLDGLVERARGRDWGSLPVIPGL